MKFCIHTQFYKPEMGAPQARLSELASFLSKSGYEVTILTAMPNYPTGKIFNGYNKFFLKEKIDNVEVIRSFIFPSKSIRLIPRLLSYLSFVISSFIAGLKYLRKPDIILTESPPLFLGISGFLISKIYGAKWIYNVSDLWLEAALETGMLKDGLSLKALNYLESLFFKNAWFITGQSNEIVNKIKMKEPNTIVYKLSNGVDVKKYKSSIKRKNKLIKKEYSIVYAGLHGIAQGLDQLLKVASLAQQYNDNFQFILIGDGPEKSNLLEESKRLKLKNVEFRDPLDREKIPLILSNSDIAIIPLKQYIPGAVPSKLYEAMALKIPVVLIGLGEPAEIVKKSKCGIDVKPNDIKGIYEAIKKLTLKEGLRVSMGENGRETVKKQFNRKIILTDFVSFLKKQVNKMHN